MNIIDYNNLKNWISSGKDVAIATVIKTWGSSPRPIGSQLFITSDGEIEGSVSGGCVEASVVFEGVEAIKQKMNKVLDYGVSNENAFSVGLACGGEIKILVEPVGLGEGISKKILEKICYNLEIGKPFVVATNIKTFERLIIEDDSEKMNFLKIFGFEKELNLFANNQSFFEKDWFINKFFPKIDNVIIGAVHITKSLVMINDLLGINSIIIDPRSSFATNERFPNHKLIVEWPDEVLNKIKLNYSRTALVTLTHDPKIDDPAIEFSINNKINYIGCLGSKNTHKKRLNRFEAKGFSNTQLKKLYAPIGIDINALNPNEIALSIASQITSHFNEKN